MWYAELPFGRGKHFGSGWNRVTDFIVGGWALSGMLHVQTGYWQSPYYSGGTDPAGINFFMGPPDRVASGNFHNQGLQPGDYFMDPKAFVMPPNNAGRFGTSGIFFWQEPSWWRLDAGLQKSFPIKERLRFEFMCKSYNLPNHGYWFPGTFYSSLNMSNAATFGTASGKMSGSRTIGFLGRLAW
jgi:hypothetical protein